MSNTNTRIISAVLMLLALVLLVIWGKIPTVIAWCVTSFLMLDELLVNFAKKLRTSKTWVLSHGLLAILYILLATQYYVLLPHLKYIPLLFNLLLIWLLFLPEDKSIALVRTIFGPLAGLLALYVFLVFSGVIFIYYAKDGLIFMLLTVLITTSSDAGAWLCGKLLGKHKLWPSVSPNKTIEGAVGGIIICAIALSIAWSLLFQNWHPLYLLVFSALSIAAQIGDLVESKLKRLVDIKDSSQLIPGHGGIFDRFDSIIFAAPFFLFSLDFLPH